MEYIEIVSKKEKAEYKVGESTINWRRMGREKYLEIQRKHTDYVRDEKDDIVKTVVGRPIKEVDNDAVYADTIDYIITGWYKVKAVGKDIECNRANKLELPGLIREDLISLSNTRQITDAEEKKTE